MTTAASSDSPQDAPWGRVDEDGTVSVREGDQWRVVGQYPDGTTEEALAYFERKFSDLASEVTLVEVRHRRGGAAASDLKATVRGLRERLSGAAAVGDLAALDARLVALESVLEDASAEEAAAAREAVDAAVAERTALVEEMEKLAEQNPGSIQWKQTSAAMQSLFDRWQGQQTNGPRIPKAAGQQLWKRFRAARTTLEGHRREFFAGLDQQHKSARDVKTRLIERAEALASQGEDGIPSYRNLLDEWKRAGRAGKKIDDALWERFKAAGDALYGARIEREKEEAEASVEKIAAKQELLEKARQASAEKDLAAARKALTSIQRQWDDIGRVFPRDKDRSLDDAMRKIEQSVKSREDTDWRSNSPEKQARQSDMASQLHDVIEKLEAELAAAEKSGDKKAIAAAKDALDARKAWLSALGL